MKLLDIEIKCSGRGDRVEIFPLWDIHMGKHNCNETALKKEVADRQKRDEMLGRHIRVLLGGDAANAIKPNDLKRFDFSDIADWLLEGKVADVKDKLSNMTAQEVKRVCKILDPIKHLIVGALEGNHEKCIRKRSNQDVQTELCDKLGIPDLSDEAVLSFKFASGHGGAGLFYLIVFQFQQKFSKVHSIF